MDLPYSEIARLLEQGKIVPFLGHGANSGQRPAGLSYDENSRFLPSRHELSVELAMASSFPATEDPSNLAKVASYYAETRGRSELVEKLHAIFARDYEPTGIHLLLASIKRPLLIVTTNHDDLVERALMRAGRRFDLVIAAADRKDLEASVLHRKHGTQEFVGIGPLRLNIDLDATTVVYKMLGSVASAKEGDNYVITEDDHLRLLARMTGQAAVPAQFMRRMRERSLLFLGLGLRDWNERLLLRHLRPIGQGAGSTAADPARAGLPSWAIQDNPSVAECELWAARRVKVFDQDLGEFAAGVRSATNSVST